MKDTRWQRIRFTIEAIFYWSIVIGLIAIAHPKVQKAVLSVLPGSLRVRLDEQLGD
jgi:uncharacterized membrane protein YwaF